MRGECCVGEGVSPEGGRGAFREAFVSGVPPVLVVRDWRLVREGEAVVVGSEGKQWCLRGGSCAVQ